MSSCNVSVTSICTIARAGALTREHERLSVRDSADHGDPPANLRAERERLVDAPRESWIDDELGGDGVGRRWRRECRCLRVHHRQSLHRERRPARPAQIQTGLVFRVRDAVPGQDAIQIIGRGALAIARGGAIDVNRVQRLLDFGHRHLGTDLGLQNCRGRDKREPHVQLHRHR